MLKLLSLLALAPFFVPSAHADDEVLDANAPVALTCKTSTKPEQINEWTPGLHQFSGLKDLKVKLTLKTVTISHENWRTDLKGNSEGALPTETYTVEKLGTDGKLVLASAGPLLGAKSVIISLHAKGVKPDDKKGEAYHRSVQLSCKNENPGKRAAFIKLCVDAPEFENTECKVRNNADTYGMPEKFSFVTGKKGAIDVSYVDENNDSAEESFAFIPNDEPKMNATIKLLEYCYFAVKGKTQSTFHSLRVSRALAEKGKGFASISEQGSDGGASIPYDCQ